MNFGGTLGGPIRRDRIFFFGSFQGEEEVARRFADLTASFLTPTESGLATLAEAFPDSSTVRDLMVRGPLAREVGSSQIQRTFLIPALGVPVEFGQVTRIVPSRTRGYETGLRFDFILTSRDRVQANYWYDNRRAIGVTGRQAAGYIADAYTHAQLGGVRWERSISPRTTNEIAFSFNRARLSLNPGFDAVGLETEFVQATAGGPPVATGLTPGVNIGFRGLAYGGDPFIPASQVSTAFEVSDALSYIVRRHNVKLGGQARFRVTRFDYLPGAGGYYNYASFEDFAQDRPFALTVAAGDPRSRFTGGHFHFYADDSWRVRSNLTLSVGLSYENASQPINSLADRLPENANFLTPIGRVRGDNNNIAPRFGFAYTPDFRVLGRNIFGFDRTVIRGGVSIAYDQPAYRPLADVAASAPNVLLGVLTPSLGVAVPPFPNVPDATQLRAILDRNPGSRARTELTPDFRSPYAAQWNLSATRDFNDRFILELGYLGTRGVGLIRALDASNGQTGFVRVYASTGRSIYHALQARAEVRLRRPVTLPTERVLTSGCGGGITFRIDHRLFPRLRSPLRVRPAELAARMKDLFAAAVQYQASRGIHGAALADPDRVLIVAEDVGRHNAVDKVKGEALLRGVPTEDRILLSTGRISSEMLLKAARMGVPVVASRTSPTEMAVALAEQLGVTVCGYVRPDGLNLYAGEAVVLGEPVGARG